jgi:hypothetical protein
MLRHNRRTRRIGRRLAAAHVQNGATRFPRDLRERLAMIGLASHPDKTA